MLKEVNTKLNKYTVIADISSYLLELLKINMVPEPILNGDSIGVCSPNEKGDLTLGVYLYDVKESEEIQGNSMINIGNRRQKYPPTYLSLFYMVTAYSNTDFKTKYLDDQRIIGRAVQVLGDNSTINLSQIMNSSNITIQEGRIQMLNLNNEEKMKIWNAPSVPYKLSMCFKIAPIELESTRVKNVARVVEAITTIQEK